MSTVSYSVTSGSSQEGPFSGTWEQDCIGWAGGAAGGGGHLETYGTIDVVPSALTSIGMMASVSMSGFFSANPVVIVTGNPGGTQTDLGPFTVAAPGGETLHLDGGNPAHFGYYTDNGSSGTSSDFPTWIFDATKGVTGVEFVASEVTIVEIVANITLNGQAAGYAGSDILLQWSTPNCDDTQFVIKQDGETIATIPAINYGNNVIGTDTSPATFNYGYAVAQLTPNTAYTFQIIGDSNGSSNVADITTGCRGVEIFNCDCSIVTDFQTLGELRQRVLIRLGYPNQASNPPPGMTLLVNDFLYGAQKLIWKQLSRAGLNTERFFRWVMVPGQRYYGINANADKCDLKLDPYKIVWAGFEDLNQAWYRLTEGIPPEYYTRANINFGWPTHYEVRSCIEIFPAPQAPYQLWIKGDFGLASFVDDDDPATIDSEAVFLLALGNAKAHYGQRDSASVLAQADTYIRGLVAGLHGTRRYVPRTKIQNPATPPRFLPLGNEQA